MLYRSALLLLLTFFLIVPITNLAQSADKLPPIKVTEYKLDNGLRVIFHQDRSTPVVAVNVWYHVGSKNEAAGKTGFAHLFEHMMFQGSRNYDTDYFTPLQEAGGSINGTTNQDRTYYYETVPSNFLELALFLEADRMGGLLEAMTQEKLDNQRDVVKNERRQRVDNQPYGRLLEEAMKRLYTKHPYHHSVIGSMDHLDAAEEKDYVQFYKDFYRPDNAILSIAGDIDIEQSKKLIEVYFKDIPKGKGEVFRPKVVEPPLSAEIRDTVYDNVQLPAVVFTYHIPAQGTADFYAVKMLNMLLSKGKSSRMQKAIVDEQQKAVAAGSFSFDLEDPGPNIMYGIANVGVNPEDLEKSMNEVISGVQQNLISETELQKLQNQIENDFVTSNTTVAGIAESLANYEMYYNDANLINTELERFRKVTRQDIQRVAKKYYANNARVVLYWLPKGKQP